MVSMYKTQDWEMCGNDTANSLAVIQSLDFSYEVVQ